MKLIASLMVLGIFESSLEDEKAGPMRNCSKFAFTVFKELHLEMILPEILGIFIQKIKEAKEDGRRSLRI